MQRLIRYGNIVDDPLYNCSARTPELVKYAITEPDPIYGALCASLSFITEIIFIFCVKVMFEQTIFIYPAYKIMIVMSICDIIETVCNGIVFGIIFYYGTTFCDAPNSIYINGSLGACFWVTGSLLSSILILNRLVELNSTQNTLLMKVFNGKYTPCIMLFPLFCGLYYFFFEPSMLLNAKIGLAVWDPLIYENATAHYISPLLVFNNTIVVTFNSILSIFLCFNLTKRLRDRFGSVIHRRRQATLCFQCLAIVSLCNIAALQYLIIFFFQCPPIFMKSAGFLYQLCTGLPPYIYLILNRSVRQGTIKIFKNLETYSNIFTRKVNSSV